MYANFILLDDTYIDTYDTKTKLVDTCCTCQHIARASAEVICI